MIRLDSKSTESENPYIASSYYFERYEGIEVKNVMFRCDFPQKPNPFLDGIPTFNLQHTARILSKILRFGRTHGNVFANLLKHERTRKKCFFSGIRDTIRMRWVSAFILTFLFVTVLFGQPDTKTNIAVLNLDLSGMPETYQRGLTNRLNQELFKTGIYNVMERDKMETILREQAFSLSECVSTECAVKVGQLLAVEQMVAGSVSLIGESYTISLRLIDVTTGQIIDVADVDCTCSIEQVLSTRIGEAARRLAGLSDEPRVTTTTMGKGRVHISSEPAGGFITIDNTPQVGIVTPADVEMAAGSHTIRVVKGDLVGYAEMYILSGMLGETNIELRLGRGSLYVDSTPNEANIYLDGRSIGVTPLSLDTLTAGSYTLRAEKDGHIPQDMDITIRREKETSKTFILIPRARFTLNTIYDDVSITTGGATRIMQAGDSWEVDPGRHRIRARLLGYHTITDRLTFRPGQETKLKLDFEPKTRLQAALRSSLLPGAGQRFAGHKTRGWVFTLLQAGAIAYSAYSYMEYEDAQDQYDKAEELYTDAVTTSQLNSAKTEMRLAHENLQDKTDLFNYSLMGVGAIYSINLFDVTFLGGGRIRFSR